MYACQNKLEHHEHSRSRVGLSGPFYTHFTQIVIWEVRWPHGWSAFDSGSSGPVSGPGREHCITVPLSTQVYKRVLATMLGVTLRCTSIPSRRE